MSSIWGMVNLSGKILESNQLEIFLSEYKRKTKQDSYDVIIKDKAIIGRGLQKITAEDQFDTGIICHTRIVQDSKKEYESEIVFAADAILDNRKQLINALKEDVDEESSTHNYDEKSSAHNYDEKSDSEIMYLTYQKYGMDFVHHCIGTYAAAIWDGKKLTLISDHVASRALYYTRIDDVIIFSTILSPIEKLMENPRINESYIKDFLLSEGAKIYTVPGETHIKDVYLMRPATYIQFSIEQEKQEKYWTPKDDDKLQKKSPEDCILEFVKIYSECVNASIRTTGNVGITLSGGLDSSSIAALAAKNLAEKNLSENNLEKKNFESGTPDDNKLAYKTNDIKTLHSYTSVPEIKTQKDTENRIYDESVLVDDIVKMYPNIRPKYLSNAGKSDFTDIKEIHDIFEMPYKTAPFSSHLEICKKAAADGCKVILVGEYGNTSVSFGELDNILFDFYWKKQSSSMIKYASNYCNHEGLDAQEYLMNKLSIFRAYEKFVKEGHSVYDNFIPDNIFVSPEILKDYNLPERMKQDTRATLSKGFITEKQYKDFVTGESLQIYLGVLKTKFGLATGTILRDPTMDKRMIEFCYNINFSYFAYNGTNRFLIREGFKNMLPDSIIDRWSLKGVQSADWSQRIARDWQALKPYIIDLITKAPKEWILVDKLIESIDEIIFDEADSQEKILSSLFSIVNVTILLENFTLE